DVTFSVEAARADELYDEAVRAVERLPPGEAFAVLKATSSEVRTLWLSREHRDKSRVRFGNLFDRVKSAMATRDKEWKANQHERLDRLEDTRKRRGDTLRSVRANISINRSKLAEARSSEWRTRY